MEKLIEVSADIIRELPDMRATIRTCILVSGLPLKAVAYELDIKPDHLSKMINPSEDPRHFPPNKIEKLMQVCNNHVPLLWLLFRMGFDQPRTVGTLQDENARLKSEIKRLQSDHNHVMNIFKNIEVR
ncbi:MAG TPA: hypothetical protein DCZ63_08630 [Geobacter sp.]|nr:hypothetical protein [Geobacter sp.]